VILVLVLLVGGISLYQRNRARTDLALRIADIRGKGTPQGIEDLKKAIALYEARVEEHVQDMSRAGLYWKILATRLSDRGLYGEALDALKRALEYYPQDSALYNQTGLVAGILATDTLNFPGSSAQTQRQEYLNLAESAYIRSIELNDTYLKPRYGLAVLYVFELNRPDAAIPLLERFLEISTMDTDAMFVLARACYMAGRNRDALHWYERIAEISRDPQRRAEAGRNRDLILGIGL
jgi:tetratricopeptide (TPR) repeat protein